MKMIHVCLMALACATVPTLASPGTISALRRTLELYTAEVEVSTRKYSEVEGTCATVGGATCGGKCCVSDSGTACTPSSPCCIEQSQYPRVYSMCKSASKRELELQQDELEMSTRKYSEVEGTCATVGGATCGGKCCVSDSGTACTPNSPCCIEQSQYPRVYSMCKSDNKREMNLVRMLNELIKRVSEEKK